LGSFLTMKFFTPKFMKITCSASKFEEFGNHFQI
jgi:hypothetical protein